MSEFVLVSSKVDRLLVEAMRETVVLSRVWDTEHVALLQHLLEEIRRELNGD